MSDAGLRYYRCRWPDETVPDGEPLWLHYEVDRTADAVLRTVEVFPDATVTRNSIAIDQPKEGPRSRSLLEYSFDDLVRGDHRDETSRAAFEELYARGTDRPFWFPG